MLRESPRGISKTALCENCVTECCTVVMGTAIAMGARRVSINNFSYLRLKWRTPKAGVTDSNPVGRANFPYFNQRNRLGRSVATPGHALRKCHVSAKVRYTSDSVFPTLTCASDVSKDQGKGAHLLADPATKKRR